MKISNMLFEKERREESNCYIQRALDAVARSTHIEERYQIPESVAIALSNQGKLDQALNLSVDIVIEEGHIMTNAFV
ncbi:hypothetical protein ES703_62750 [subsurface metagenome]